MIERLFTKALRAVALCIACLYVPPAQTANQVSIHKNEQSGLLTWTSEGDGFSMELIQLLPDFVRAIFSKHDFPDSEIERIASYCVFGSIIKNTSRKPLSYRVADWRYRDQQGKEHPVKTKSQWLEQWRRLGIKFSWVLLPDSGEFETGDWQQGFTTIKMPRDSSFDLIYTWRLDGVQHEATLQDLRCPPETLP